MNFSREQAMQNPRIREALLKEEQRVPRVEGAGAAPTGRKTTHPYPSSPPASISFTVHGLACGTNNLYATVGNRRVPTKRGREWKKKVAAAAREAWPHGPLPGPFSVYIRTTYPDKRRRDVDSAIKPILDALTGIVWEDDSQITGLVASKRMERGVALVAVDVYKEEARHG